MGLISRVSSRTYRYHGSEGNLQAPTLEEAKQEVRPKPDRSIRSNPKQQLATTKGYRWCLPTTIQRSGLPPRNRLRNQQGHPTHLPRPLGLQEILGAQCRRVELFDDEQPSVGVRDRKGRQL